MVRPETSARLDIRRDAAALRTLAHHHESEGTTMNEIEHLLTILSEECAELAQRASKAARFGVMEVQAGQEETNATRLLREFYDVVAMMDMLEDADPTFFHGVGTDHAFVHGAIFGKKQRVRGYMNYARRLGTLT